MDDLIKRQDAIDACLNGCCACVSDCVDEIEKLPSAHKTGKWAQVAFSYRCSACQEDSDWPSEYCPWCGAKMEWKNDR